MLIREKAAAAGQRATGLDADALVLVSRLFVAAFAAARALYASAGFQQCPPFGDYIEGPHSTCMTLELEPS